MIKSVAYGTASNALCHCYLNYQQHGLDIMSYPDDWEDEPLDYPNNGQDTLGYPDPIDYPYEKVDPLAIRYPNSREDDQYDYPDVWEDYNHIHRCEVTIATFPY